MDQPTTTYFENASISCACGASYTIGSTVEKMTVEVCSACHPFYTGTQKFIDSAGRVERFIAKVEAGKVHRAKQETKKIKIIEDKKIKKDQNDENANS